MARSLLFCPSATRALGGGAFLAGCYGLVHFATQAQQQLSFNRFHPASFQPVGPVSLLSAPLAPALHTSLVVLCLLLAAIFAVGYRYRFVGPIFALLALWLGAYRSSWGMIFHTENLLVMHLLVLGFAPAAVAGSLDARRHLPTAKQREPAPHFGWPLRLLSAVTTLAYCVAGIAKLRNGGLAWIHNETLRNYIADNNLRKHQLGVWHSPVGAYLVRFGGLWNALALVTVGFELLAPLALLHPLVGKIWVAICWSFHAGVLATMAILFGYPLTGAAFASFFEVEKHRPLHWILSRLSSPAASESDDRPSDSPADPDLFESRVCESEVER